MENMVTKVEVLVVDDEAPVAAAIKSALRFCGYSSSVVLNGEAALESIRAEPDRYGLVLTDHNMPELSGLALVKELRAMAYPGRIVILSGYLSDEVEAKYEALSVDKILAKPFNVERLRQALDGVLNPACPA
jgi:CheY-like chemotaxis protein